MGDSPMPNLGGSSETPLLLVPRHAKRKLLGMLKWIRLVALNPGSPTRPVMGQLEMMTARLRKTREILSRSTAIETRREFPSPAFSSPGVTFPRNLSFFLKHIVCFYLLNSRFCLPSLFLQQIFFFQRISLNFSFLLKILLETKKSDE